MKNAKKKKDFKIRIHLLELRKSVPNYCVSECFDASRFKRTTIKKSETKTRFLFCPTNQ